MRPFIHLDVTRLVFGSRWHRVATTEGRAPMPLMLGFASVRSLQQVIALLREVAATVSTIGIRKNR